MPKPYDVQFYDRLSQEYAEPRQYSGYSSGASAAPENGGEPPPPERISANMLDTLMRDPQAERTAALARIERDRSLQSPAYEAMMQGLAENRGVPMPAPQGGYYNREQYERMAQKYPYQESEEQARNAIMRKRFGQNLLHAGEIEPYPAGSMLGARRAIFPFEQGPIAPQTGIRDIGYMGHNLNAMARDVKELYDAPDFRKALHPYLVEYGLATGKYQR